MQLQALALVCVCVYIYRERDVSTVEENAKGFLPELRVLDVSKKGDIIMRRGLWQAIIDMRNMPKTVWIPDSRNKERS